ncbi:hypothetical protein HHK36_012401 [Tetracentron sinense]|uniref:Uncharacterized protein n=1 Tax=Tetracentron sinense TaxID=13715 RepID=A0A835DI26_TETSI|nr:hypothetical protein HHK36_012401 [Tetracentron sinense]
MSMRAAYSYCSNVGSLSLYGISNRQCWAFILYLMIEAVHGIAAIRHMELLESDSPTHLNFFRAALQGRHRILSCAKDPTVCLDREKNPWGGSTCCYQKFCKDITNDPNHCGACGQTCAHGFLCCGGQCVDIRNDPGNCGSCYEECPGQLKCSFAMCDYGG